MSRENLRRGLFSLFLILAAIAFMAGNLISSAGFLLLAIAVASDGIQR